MTAQRLTPEEFDAAFGAHAPHVYNTAAFALHNQAKAEELHFLAFGNPAPRLGIILGQRGGILLSPFSAPFGGFTAIGPQWSDTVDQAVMSLQQYCRSLGLNARITLPPPIYSHSFVSQQTVALARHGQLLWADINHHRTLPQPGQAAQATFKQKARNAFNRASRAGITVCRLDSQSRTDMDRMYAVIEQNHRELDHPLRMSADEVFATAPITGSRIFIATHDGADIAAAMINAPTPYMAQVIYWGDISSGRPLHPMNLLAAEIMSHCRQMGFHTLDIGPSSEQGILAPGLCRFKESLGCEATAKPTFQL